MNRKGSTKRSIKCKTKAPIIPITTIHGPPKSIAGTIKLNEVVASITPTEKPSITSSSLSETFLAKSTGKAPAPVAKPAPMLATEPSHINSKLM
jgi:hypothetical protein